MILNLWIMDFIYGLWILFEWNEMDMIYLYNFCYVCIKGKKAKTNYKQFEWSWYEWINVMFQNL